MTKIIFITLAALAVFMVACDPGFEVTFENRTDNDIRVSVRKFDLDRPAFDVVPGGESISYTYLDRSDKDRRVTIVDYNGNILLEEVFTLSALKAAGAGFVIEEDDVVFR